MNVTPEEKEYILQTLKTLTFNVADCIGLLSYCDTPDYKRDIVKDTLNMDLEYLMKFNTFITAKLNNKGE